MALSPSLGVSTNYSGSALRFGLLDIKPIEVAETIKRFGLKFKRISRRFEPLKPSQSFADWATFQNEVIFAKIDVPNWFEAEKLVKLYSQTSVEHYEKDTEMKEAIEKIRKSKRIEGPLLSFTSFMKNRFESRREEYLEVEAARFLTSNFPLSFYNKFVILDNTYYDFLRILENTIRRYEFLARYGRSFTMYSKHIDEMKRAIRPLLEQMESCFFLSSCLKKYVMIWNTKSYEKIEGPEFLDIKNINYSKFEQLNNELKMKLTETRGFLLKYDPNVLQKKVSLENETAKMFSKLVMLPSDSLSIER